MRKKTKKAKRVEFSRRSDETPELDEYGNNPLLAPPRRGEFLRMLKSTCEVYFPIRAWRFSYVRYLDSYHSKDGSERHFVVDGDGEQHDCPISHMFPLDEI